MPMDYFVWLAVSPERTVLIDTGFKRDVGNRRGRTTLRSPADALKLAGVDAASIADVILTHGHYDHIGSVSEFPSARLFLQEAELDFITGRSMTSAQTRRSFEHDDVADVIRALFEDRLQLLRGSRGLWPGLSVHLVGGHTPGMQVVRVHTRRGWVVLASDASHYYENMETGRPFSTTFDAEAVLAGFRTPPELADSTQHIIPGHDPEVLRRYPAPSPDLEGAVASLDIPPVEG